MNRRDTKEIRRYLARLPKRGVMAEVGVAAGDMAALILEVCDPCQLLLVDPWIPYGDPREPLSTLREADHDAAYRSVLRRFKDSPSVQIWRQRSLQAAEKAHEEQIAFDFVYIDADHRRDGVLADLQAWSGLLVPGGAIGGHDYTSRRADIGVIPAIGEFCRTSGFALVHVTREIWPSFLLRRPC